MTRDIRDAVTGQRGTVTIGSQLRPPFDCHANGGVGKTGSGPGTIRPRNSSTVWSRRSMTSENNRFGEAPGGHGPGSSASPLELISGRIVPGPQTGLLPTWMSWPAPAAWPTWTPRRCRVTGAPNRPFTDGRTQCHPGHLAVVTETGLGASVTESAGLIAGRATGPRADVIPSQQGPGNTPLSVPAAAGTGRRPATPPAGRRPQTIPARPEGRAGPRTGCQLPPLT